MEDHSRSESDMPNKRRHMRPSLAVVLSLLLPFLLYILIVLLAGDTLFFFSRIPPGREDRAALAIRDNEIPFFKWGTRLFTEGYLRKYYADYWYFTQASRGDGEEAFIAALTHALNNYPGVDLFLLAHTNEYIRWVEPLPESLRQRIRFVYNTGCHNKPQGAEWLALGAESYIGHPGESASEFFYVFLLRHWTRGVSLAEALDIGNRGMMTKFRQIEFLTGGRRTADALMRESRASSMGRMDLRLEDAP